MRKIVSLIVTAILCSVIVFAQTRTISGKIKDETGKPVPFASVTIKGTKKGVTADNNGAFTLDVSSGSVLVISSQNFETYEAKVGTSPTLEVSLRSSGQLSEVVVTTALGVRKQPRQLGYSVATISGADVTAAKATNIQSGLTGKVSGLNISTTNNGVFADTRITLRGIRSITGNNQPLLVLDGSPVSLGMLNNINPNDLDDVTVLKGASAAALYGPDGVNGVIVVRTKRGSKTGAPVITLSNSTQFESVLFLPDFQKQFGSGSSVDINGFGVYDPFENQQYGPEYDGTVREIGRPLPDGTVQTEVYSYKKKGRLNFFETGLTLQNGISYSAKDFTLSVNDIKIKGTLGGDQNRRTTFRFSSAKEYGKFKAGYSVNYTRGKYNVASTSPYWEVFNTSGQIDLAKYKDWRTDVAASPNHYYNEYYQNPYFIKDRARSTGMSDDIFAQVDFSYKVTNWLDVTYRASSTMFNSDYSNTGEAFVFSNFAHNVSHKFNASNDIAASVADGAARSTRLTSDLFITATKKIKDFSLEAMLGQSLRQTMAKNVDVSGSNLIIPSLYNISNRTGEPGAGESNSKTRLMGVFGKVSIGYKNWVFGEFTARNDWDSRLPQDNLNYFFPGGSLSVVLSDALSFIKNSSVISYLKVRGSYNKSGNVNVGVYSLEPIYNPAGGFPYGSLPGFQGTLNVNNPAIKPEFVHTKEVGLEVSVLKNRVNFEATYYNQYNSQQIINLAVSRATGYSSALVNAANFSNTGFEFDLRLTPLVKLGNFRVNVKANLSLLRSKVNSVYEGLDEIPIGNGNYAIKGYPAFMFKLTDYKRDPNGHVIVDATTGYPSLDPTIKLFGQTMPKTIAGINPTFSYKQLSLTATVDYRGGHQVYHGIGPDMDFTGSSTRSGTNGRQRFVVPNSVYWDGTKYVPNTSILVANGGYGFYENTNINRGVNSNYISSAAAWKIREVAISYDLPAGLVQKTKFIKSVNIGLSARNFFTFLPKSNQWTDPEFANTTGNALGVNNSNQLPPNRLYGFNVSVQF